MMALQLIAAKKTGQKGGKLVDAVLLLAAYSELFFPI